MKRHRHTQEILTRRLPYFPTLLRPTNRRERASLARLGYLALVLIFGGRRLCPGRFGHDRSGSR